MSTINTENLTLYANPFLYNGSRYKYYQTNRDYESWLQSSSASVITKTVYFKSLTENMELNEPVKDLLSYTYGKLTNDGKSYYIFIDNIRTDQHGKSYISFSVDWWATEWANIHPTKAHLLRSPEKPRYMPQPFIPLKVSFDSVSLDGNKGKGGSIMFTYIPSLGEQPSYISLGFIEITEENIALVQNGYWYQDFKIPGADIKDCFIVPMVLPSDIATSENTIELVSVNSGRTTQDTIKDIIDSCVNSFRDRFPGIQLTDYFPKATTTIIPDDFGTPVYDESTNRFYRIWYVEDILYGIDYRGRVYDVDISEYPFKKALVKYVGQIDGEYVFDGYYMTLNDTSVEAYSFEITGLDITSTEAKTMGISDWNSDIVWECPYGITVTSFTVRLLIGISHILLEFIPNGSDKNGSKLTGAGFAYDCRHPGLFVDSYKDYILKNRDYDIAMRQIQSEKQLWAAAASTAENIGFGYAFGQQKGGIAAGFGGVVETAATFAINQEFDPRIQQQYDKRYQRMTDQISLVGDSVTNVFNEKENGLLQLYTLDMDEASIVRMNKDIEINGYVCDEYISNLESIFNEGVILQADNVTVEGSTCLEAKHQTVYRLKNGVEFI